MQHRFFPTSSLPPRSGRALNPNPNPRRRIRQIARPTSPTADPTSPRTSRPEVPKTPPLSGATAPSETSAPTPLPPRLAELLPELVQAARDHGFVTHQEIQEVLSEGPLGPEGREE